MADLGKTLYVGETTPYITRADGYAPPDGYLGYSYNFISSDNETELGTIISVLPLDRVSDSLPSPPAGGAIIYYVMRGLDVDCAPTITYRTWTVTGSPDTTGAQYAGPKCGASALTDIVVILKYTS